MFQIPKFKLDFLFSTAICLASAISFMFDERKHSKHWAFITNFLLIKEQESVCTGCQGWQGEKEVVPRGQKLYQIWKNFQ